MLDQVEVREHNLENTFELKSWTGNFFSKHYARCCVRYLCMYLVDMFIAWQEFENASEQDVIDRWTFGKFDCLTI